MNHKLLKRHNELVEDLGSFFEKDEHLAPIEGRILAMIILSGKRGVTFDEIKCALSVGKSTVSAYLDDLQARQRVEFYMKPGDRKRYFIVKRNSLDTSFAKLEDQWSTRQNNFRNVLNYQEECVLQGIVDKDTFDVEFLKNFIKYAGEVINAIQHLRNEMTKFN